MEPKYCIIICTRKKWFRFWNSSNEWNTPKYGNNCEIGIKNRNKSVSAMTCYSGFSSGTCSITQREIWKRYSHVSLSFSRCSWISRWSSGLSLRAQYPFWRRNASCAISKPASVSTGSKRKVPPRAVFYHKPRKINTDISTIAWAIGKFNNIFIRRVMRYCQEISPHHTLWCRLQIKIFTIQIHKQT